MKNDLDASLERIGVGIDQLKVRELRLARALRALLEDYEELQERVEGGATAQQVRLVNRARDALDASEAANESCQRTPGCIYRNGHSREFPCRRR